MYVVVEIEGVVNVAPDAVVAMEVPPVDLYTI
jgi:hypothetical protein